MVARYVATWKLRVFVMAYLILLKPWNVTWAAIVVADGQGDGDHPLTTSMPWRKDEENERATRWLNNSPSNGRDQKGMIGMGGHHLQVVAHLMLSYCNFRLEASATVQSLEAAWKTGYLRMGVLSVRLVLIVFAHCPARS